MLLWLTAALAGPPYLIVRAEPLGSGDDRTATAIELQVRAAPEPWVACWNDHVTGDSEPLRFLQLELKMRSRDGSVRKVKVRSATGHAALDACATTLAKAIVLDPPPVFEDRIQFSVTWSVAEPGKKPEE